MDTYIGKIILGITLALIKPKFYKTKKIFGASAIRILDIGTANKSYEESRLVYPTAKYTGLDLYAPSVIPEKGDEFLQMNLEDIDGTKIENIYDLIIMNHVLEHLGNGEDVFRILCRKIAEHGVVYAEFPSIKTMYKPKNGYRYHFHDDPTHKRIYSLETLVNIAMEEGLKIHSCGNATTPLKSLLSIPRALIKMFMGGNVGGELIFIQGKVSYILCTK